MSSALPFDADLLGRYNRLGSRYSSYPTASQFNKDFSEEQLREAVLASNGDPIPRQLSLYVHVPFCLIPCSDRGRNRITPRDKGRVEIYLARLYREIDLTAALFDRDREVIQLHFGGDTPNFLSPAQLREVVGTLRRQFHFCDSPERDISVELDPRFISPADVLELAGIGFNRASLGVQDFDPLVQAAASRIHGVEETRALIGACRAGGFKSVNVDLNYGLPKQNAAGFARTLDTICRMRPERLAVYSYPRLPTLFKLQNQIEAADLPTPETRLALMQLAIEKLTAAGYLYIGMDNFALPDDELAQAQANGTLHRDLKGYTTHADSDMIGLGVSAIGHIGDTFSQNPRDLLLWEQAIDEGRLPVARGTQLNRDDQLRADLIQRLICQGEVSIGALEQRYAIKFATYFAEALARLRPLAADGLVSIESDRIKVSPHGRLLLSSIAMCFDRYLDHAAAVTSLGFSRAI